MTAPLDTLARFARKEVDHLAALRSLVSHDGWFAPATFAMEAFATNVFDKMCLWGNETRGIPPGKLFLFTDETRGPILQARGADPGPCVGPLRGSTIFAKLPNGIQSLEVNPGSPTSEGFFIDAQSFPLARAWGRAIALETALENGSSDMIDRLIAYDDYGILVTPAMSIATLVGAAGLKNPGMVFTTLDSLVRLKEKIGVSASTLKETTMRGAVLFEKVASFGIDGLILNPVGPGPVKVFDASVCEGIAQSARDAIEIARLRALAGEG
jgi:hypothetical protein